MGLLPSAEGLGGILADVLGLVFSSAEESDNLLVADGVDRSRRSPAGALKSFLKGLAENMHHLRGVLPRGSEGREEEALTSSR